MVRSSKPRLTGDEEFIGTLTGVIGRVEDPGPIFNKFQVVVAAHNAKVFATQGAYGGHRWPPRKGYSNKTRPGRMTRRSNHHGGPLLVRTGRLLRSLTRVPLAVFRVMGRSAIFGTDVPYAKYHQFGTKWLPRRPPVQVNQALQRSLARTAAAHIVDGD